MRHEALTERIIACAMRVYRTLGHGFLESVYQNALTHALRLDGLQVIREKRITVFYGDAAVGDFIADIVVSGIVIVETKASRTLSPAHLAQLTNYLTATRTEVGLLVNFGAEELQVKRRAGPTSPENLREEFSVG